MSIFEELDNLFSDSEKKEQKKKPEQESVGLSDLEKMITEPLKPLIDSLQAISKKQDEQTERIKNLEQTIGTSSAVKQAPVKPTSPDS